MFYMLKIVFQNCLPLMGSFFKIQRSIHFLLSNGTNFSLVIITIKSWAEEIPFPSPKTWYIFKFYHLLISLWFPFLVSMPCWLSTVQVNSIPASERLLQRCRRRQPTPKFYHIRLLIFLEPLSTLILPIYFSIVKLMAPTRRQVPREQGSCMSVLSTTVSPARRMAWPITGTQKYVLNVEFKIN